MSEELFFTGLAPDALSHGREKPNNVVHNAQKPVFPPVPYTDVILPPYGAASTSEAINKLS